MERYHFITKWYFRAPIECVWEEIVDAQSWPTWWKNWKKVSLLNLLTKLPFARLLMEINHDDIMENGFKALKVWLEGPEARFPQPVVHW